MNLAPACDTCAGRGVLGASGCPACVAGRRNETRCAVTPGLVRDLLGGHGQVFANYLRVPLGVVTIYPPAFSIEERG